MKGKIKSLKEHFGFIIMENNRELYFNRTSLSNDVNWEDLCEGMMLEFEITKSQDKERAINCRVLENERLAYFKENVLKLSRIDSYDEFCDRVLEYASHLKKGEVTTSKLRKVYSRVLAATDVKEVKFLRPQFAYIAGRESKNLVLREFMDLLDAIVKSMDVGNEEDLKNLKQFMEAVVAYMKYLGDVS